ncbi:response regulator [Planktothrix sp. FACHB-1355]|uniref:Response regulator n=1 Tax=Aerosakkonema funiforme FACHB-1375 TaxID=2949571 RepID=A0A926VHZ1_9CYAN|nr:MULTISPECIES: response regulator [Oscillatoriales]MBD2183498.1 response regulator [Aerosakkonema funiforme FACHB-1375]MBD3558219.1 response regulator [Planktothrix sp. FACHB-1355]
MKILLIEDDSATADIIIETLTNYHWIVKRATDGEIGLQLAQTQEYDLILLDIGLPKLDGITLCKRLRSEGYENPILLLTAKDSTEAQVMGLDAGADDYIIKPFNIEILLARVRAFVRKVKTLPTLVNYENIQLNSANAEVICEGKTLPLTAKEYCLLELFLLNPKRIYTRRSILDRLWDFAEAPGEETVTTHIKCLRQKLKAAGATDPIETVYGLGYRLRSPQVAALPSPKTQTNLPSNSPTEKSAADRKAQAVTSKVWNQFKSKYVEQIKNLAELINVLNSGNFSPEQHQEATSLAHKLVGSLGMFGLIEAAQQAKQIELFLRANPLQTIQIQEAIKLVRLLQQIIEQAQTQAPPKVQASPQSPPSDALSSRILIVDDDLVLADRLRIEAIAWNLQVEIATDLKVARQMIAQSLPNIILLDLSFPGAEDGLTLMAEIQGRVPKIPVIIFTAREDLPDRIAAVRLGVSAFVRKPLSAQEILKIVTDVLKQKPQRTRGDRVLIVDDDPGFLNSLSTLLSSYGLQVTTSDHPQEFWQVLTACKPEVLILDLEMPEFDGIELCQVVRADPQWQHLKVIILSAHTETDTIAKAYAVGADAYISKSIPGTELATQILYRLQRW